MSWRPASEFASTFGDLECVPLKCAPLGTEKATLDGFFAGLSIGVESKRKRADAVNSEAAKMETMVPPQAPLNGLFSRMDIGASGKRKLGADEPTEVEKMESYVRRADGMLKNETAGQDAVAQLIAGMLDFARTSETAISRTFRQRVRSLEALEKKVKGNEEETVAPESLLEGGSNLEDSVNGLVKLARSLLKMEDSVNKVAEDDDGGDGAAKVTLAARVEDAIVNIYDLVVSRCLSNEAKGRLRRYVRELEKLLKRLTDDAEGTEAPSSGFDDDNEDPNEKQASDLVKRAKELMRTSISDFDDRQVAAFVIQLEDVVSKMFVLARTPELARDIQKRLLRFVRLLERLQTDATGQENTLAPNSESGCEATPDPDATPNTPLTSDSEAEDEPGSSPDTNPSPRAAESGEAPGYQESDEEDENMQEGEEVQEKEGLEPFVEDGLPESQFDAREDVDAGENVDDGEVFDDGGGFDGGGVDYGGVDAADADGNDTQEESAYEDDADAGDEGADDAAAADDSDPEDAGGEGADDASGAAAADPEEVDEIDKLVGRAVTLYNGRKQRWCLVKWRGVDAKDATWMPRAYFDTPAKKTLLSDYERRTGGRDDPNNVGFVRGVVATRQRGRGAKRHTEYQVRWLVDEGVPDIVAREWLRRRQIVNPNSALGEDDAGSEDDQDDSDTDDADPFDDDSDDDAQESAIVWDAGAARMKLSVSGAIAALETEPTYLLDALDEWCTWRLYLLQCVAPRRSVLTAADLETLTADLYDIDRERLDSLKDDDEDQEEHEKKWRAQIRQRVERGWKVRSQLRIRDTPKLRGQLLALKSIRASRARGLAGDSGTGSPQAESMVVASQIDGLDAETDARVKEDALRIASSERRARASGEAWWLEFANPPARVHDQGNLLSDSKAAGGGRNKKQTLFLTWLRGMHTAKEEQFRLAGGGYARAWQNGDFGSPYSIFWPEGNLATSSTVTLEHILPSEWLRNGEIVQSGYARQDVTITTLVNAKENSSRGERALSVFGPRSASTNTRLYTPPESSHPKVVRLATATAHGILSYPLVQQETKTSGSKKFAGNFGVPEYGRRITNLVKYANSESSSVARRIALVTSHYHLWHNPLVLRSSMLRQPRYKNMLEMRLKGGRQSSDPTRLKCGLALLIDELLERVVKDGPV